MVANESQDALSVEVDGTIAPIDVAGEGQVDAIDLAMVDSIQINGNDAANLIDLSGLPFNSIDTIAVDAQGGNDIVVGSMALDKIQAGSGNDVVLGGGNNDLIDGGDGDDYLIGNSGGDTLDSGLGRDTIYGGNGEDHLLNDPLDTVGDAFFYIDDAEIVDSVAQFWIHATDFIDSILQVDVQTFDGTAVAGEDYLSRATTISFAPDGARSQLFEVELNPEGVGSSDDFFAQLSNAANAEIAIGLATATIDRSDGDQDAMDDEQVDEDLDSNSPPIAIDDFAEFPGQNDPPLVIEVVGNDTDLDGDDLLITQVGTPEEGGTAWISSNRKAIYYLPPKGTDQAIEHGGFYDPNQEFADISVTAVNAGPIEHLVDRFSYEITDDTAVAGAFVQIGNAGRGGLVARPRNETKRGFRIDGKPGYQILIKQEFVKANPKALITIPEDRQSWQKNVISTTMVFQEDDGSEKGKGRFKVLNNDIRADIRDLKPGKFNRLYWIDTMAFDPMLTTMNQKEREKAIANGYVPPKSVSYILHTVAKKLGANGRDGTIEFDKDDPQPLKLKPEDEKKLDNLDPELPTLVTGVRYLYVDKAGIEMQRANGSLPDAGFNLIKKELSSVGYEYDKLPRVFEYVMLAGTIPKGKNSPEKIIFNTLD